MENPDTDSRLKQGLQDYLTCEVLLTQFFSKFDFCRKNCLSQDIGLYRTRMDMPGDPTQFPGYAGCCPEDGFLICNDIHSANRTLLDSERIRIYGLPNEENRYCKYHTPQGCILKSHKSPSCLAYVCPEFAHFMYENYGINYSEGEIEKTLELILAGKKSSAEVQKFIEELKELSKIVESSSSNPIR